MFWNNWYEDGYIPCVYFKFGVIVSPLLSWLVFSHKIWLLIILFPNFVAFLDGFSALKIWQILPWFICFGSLIVCYIRKKKIITIAKLISPHIFKSEKIYFPFLWSYKRKKKYNTAKEKKWKKCFHFYGLTKEKEI